MRRISRQSNFLPFYGIFFVICFSCHIRLHYAPVLASIIVSNNTNINNSNNNNNNTKTNVPINVYDAVNPKLQQTMTSIAPPIASSVASPLSATLQSQPFLVQISNSQNNISNSKNKTYYNADHISRNYNNINNSNNNNNYNENNNNININDNNETVLVKEVPFIVKSTNKQFIRTNVSMRAADFVNNNNNNSNDNNFNNNNNNHSIFDNINNNVNENILELAHNLETKLRTIRNYEMGFPIVQEILDSVEFTIIIQNETTLVDEMVRKLSKKLDKAMDKLIEMEIILNESFAKLPNNTNLQSMVYPCKDLVKPLADKMVTLNTVRNHLRTLYNEDNIHYEIDYENDDVGSDYYTDGDTSSTSQRRSDEDYDKKHIEIINYIKRSSSTPTAPTTTTTTTTTTATTTTTRTQMSFINRSDIVNSIINNSFPKIIDKQSSLKRTYFFARDDYSIDNNCHLNHQHLRLAFTSTMRMKRVVLLIELGSSLSADQLELVKNFAINIVNLLNENDEIILIGVTDKIRAFTTIRRKSEKFVHKVTIDVKIRLHKFINNLSRPNHITNHTLNFQYSFKLLYEYQLTRSMDTTDQPFLMLYISRGFLMSPLMEAKPVIEAIANGQQLLNRPVIIYTCAIILDERRVVYEKQFLKDIADQNYQKYRINAPDWPSRLRYNLTGKMFTINNKSVDISRTIGTIFSYWFHDQENLETGVQIHFPVIDKESDDMIVSLTKTYQRHGVFGIDMFLSDLAEDIIYFNQHYNSYAFLIDLNGRVVMHSSYPRPMADRQANPFPSTDIKYLETFTEFEKSVRSKLLTKSEGNITIPAEGRALDKKNRKHVTYTWKRASHFYIFCVATIQNSDNSSKWSVDLYGGVPQNVHYYHQHRNGDQTKLNENLKSELLYHRIDLITPPQSNLCKHFKQLATMESGTLYLSASSFKSPFTYVRNNRDTEKLDESRVNSAKNIMAYLKDTTNLLANPGLMPQVRDDVSTLYHIITYLKKRHLEGGSLSKYIIRRYVATVNGIIQIYPGCMLNSDLEPTRRPWFKKAIEHPGKIVLTEPYLDAGGAGYIITISQTVFEGRTNALHSVERDIPVAIVSIDLTQGYFYKLLLQSSRHCSEPNIKCFLMDDKGYIIMHPGILEPMIQSADRSSNSETHIERDLSAGDVLTSSSTYATLSTPKPFSYVTAIDFQSMSEPSSSLDAAISSRNDEINESVTMGNNNENYGNKIKKPFRRPLEHITHIESYVANDFLNHKWFVQKHVCHNYVNRIKQRYYQFNTSVNDVVLTNLVPNERIKYQLTLIPGTNIFVGLLNESCSNGGIGSAFCPCSTVDRVCLNCNRMELTNCECPCECPINLPEEEDEDFRDSNNQENCQIKHGNSTVEGLPSKRHKEINKNHESQNQYKYDICETQIEQLLPFNTFKNTIMEVKSCININCELYTTQIDCLGVISCEWCQVDVDGETIFNAPFCTHQASCFNGILGSVTPYGDGGLGAANIDSNIPTPYSALGPVIGAIFVLLIVISFAIYCYRHNLDLATEQLYIDSMPETNYGLPLSRFDYDDLLPPNDECDSLNRNLLGGGGGGGGNNNGGAANCNGITLNNSITISDISSPYRVSGDNGNYRPPNNSNNNGESSDHGYSTMTPHESSIHACFSLPSEPLLHNVKRMSISDSASINTSVSSPTNQNHTCHLHSPAHHHNQKRTLQYHPCNQTPDAFLGDQTKIPSAKQMKLQPHYIQAPVTVHQAMGISS